jgi:hypothetical protein
MSENLKDILSHINPEVDQEILLQYLQGHLTPEKQHEIEAKMLDSDLESDAIEGLAAFKDKQHLAHLVDQLNRDLKKKTEVRKQRREKLRIKQDPWLWMAVLLILLLIVISYMVIHFKLRH